MALLHFNENGIYCEKADVYIDPWRPVKRALITHGHADHSRYGHKHYMATENAAPVIRHRLGNDISLQTVQYGEKVNINGVSFSFHPAGHIPGSAQIRVDDGSEVWVVSGDYKTEDDGLSEAFEPVRCDVFITECTFGLPVYRWRPQREVFREINNWWRKNAAEGKTSILTAYALGKAQRILKGVDTDIGPIYTHGAVENVNEVIRQQGYVLPPTRYVEVKGKKDDFKGALVIAPPSAIGSSWIRKFKPYSVAMASGWMALRGTRRRRAADRGFVLSDHADWDGLNLAVSETGARKVITTHGYT
ncbi:MAG: ligase-associated DNA damage response exonuclease, partial [Cyclobacteriaceae bacterium]